MRKGIGLASCPAWRNCTSVALPLTGRGLTVGISVKKFRCQHILSITSTTAQNFCLMPRNNLPIREMLTFRVEGVCRMVTASYGIFQVPRKRNKASRPKPVDSELFCRGDQSVPRVRVDDRR